MFDSDGGLKHSARDSWGGYLNMYFIELEAIADLPFVVGIPRDRDVFPKLARRELALLLPRPIFIISH